MDYNFQADIGANIKEFMGKIKQVDAEIRELATGATVGIDANIREFMGKIAAIEAMANKIQHGEVEVSIDAAISGFMRGAALVRAQAMELGRKRIVIPIQAAIANYKNVMGQIANFSRNFDEVAGVMGRGGLMFLSPAAVPVIASTVGLLGQLGPMVGTIAGSTFALASAFGTAGIGAAAFGAIAVTNLKSIFGANEELVKLQEELTKADTTEERTKILEEMKTVQGGLNDEQRDGLKAINDLKDTWSGIAGSLQTQTIEIFTKALGLLSGVLEKLKPMFTNVMDAANGLMDSLGKTIDSAPMQAFFDYLNTSAAPIMQTITEAVGFFIQGFLNMMTAFGPLAEATAAGFRNMGEGFAEWAAGLSESEKFQTFVDYVQENMPKVRSIFSDAIQGMINMFAAFAPSSETMMSSLQDMMERFKKWSATIGESKGFQNFIDYIKENGPVVISTIGSIVTFIVNLGIALAPIGAKILELVNGFLQWMNGMMQAHPWIGKIMAGAIVLGGALIGLAPIIVLVNSMFGKLVLKMIATVAKLAWTATMWIAKWALMGVQALFHAGRMAAAWFIALGPVGWITGIVIGLAILIIANWDKISAWTSKTWTAVWNWIKNAWSNIKSATAEAAANMAAKVSTKFTEISNTVNRLMDMAKNYVRDKWEEAKNQARQKLEVLLSVVKEFFGNIVTKVTEKMGEAVDTVAEFIGKMPGKVLEFVDDMVSAGADLVGGVISGIKSKIDEGLGVIGGLATSLISRFKKDTDTHSPSRAFADVSKWFAPGIVQGIDQTSGQAYNAVTALSQGLTDAFSPQLAMADMRASAQLDTSINRADTGVIRKSFAAEIAPLEIEERDQVFILDGKEVARSTYRDSEYFMQKRNNQIVASKRR